MDGDTAKPLTPEQAKARLRAAADRASPTAWLHQHPWSTLSLAVAGGFMLSRMRLPMFTSVFTARWLGTALLGAVVRQLTISGGTQHKKHHARHRSHSR
jgi:hypothetical protein